MAGGQLGSWQSADYVDRWAGDDVVGRMLETPRTISTGLVLDAGKAVRHVLDLGSGEGPYLAELLRAFPDADGTWLDVSERMLERARRPLAEFGGRVRFVVGSADDLGAAPIEPADVVASSRALHHLTPDALARCYRDVRELLTPGGWFFNLDYVGSDDDWIERYRRVRERFVGARREALSPHREDRAYRPLSEHLQWLEEAGFAAADVPWRMFHTVLLAARA